MKRITNTTAKSLNEYDRNSVTERLSKGEYIYKVSLRERKELICSCVEAGQTVTIWSSPWTNFIASTTPINA
jgi:hypothetical protein